MKEQIRLAVQDIDRILKEENAHDDWLKGRHSALRGVKSRLERILNEGIREREEPVCPTCNGTGIVYIDEDIKNTLCPDC